MQNLGGLDTFGYTAAELHAKLPIQILKSWMVLKIYTFMKILFTFMDIL